MNKLFEAANITPDPTSSLNILKDFTETNPSITQSLSHDQCHALAMLSAYSRFLASYCVTNPQAFIDGYNNIKIPIIDDLINIAPEILGTQSDINPIIRDLKKSILTKITLRFILKITNIIESMEELSSLADKLIELTFNHIKKQLEKKHGIPSNDAVTIISLGKLGARELNYSSDIDLICVYRDDQGNTSGRLTADGKNIDIISNHEFYCKLVETFSKTLSNNTENGFVYRVDLRLRPQGQKGELALSLSNYELYYETWGREWERLALIRARYAVGDKELFTEFINTIRPFVYRKYIDMGSINEIRQLKQKIDMTFSDLDIKRGRGGIREIEFFVQTFQMIYGGQDIMLRKKNLLKALHMLAQKNIIGRADHDRLSKNYIYLRHLEQIIQMHNDLQTHKLPSDPELLLALAKKMRFKSVKTFTEDLKKRRLIVRQIYDSLFTPSKTEEIIKTSTVFDIELTLDGLSKYLVNNNAKVTDNILYYTTKIKEGLNSFQTLKGRRLKYNILPEFTELALRSVNPETALGNLLNFSDILLNNESYLELFTERSDLSMALIDVFSHSSYLCRILVENPRYLDMLSGGTPIRKTINRLKAELIENLSKNEPISETICIFKKMEELRLSIMFLNKKISVLYLTKGLSKVADSVLSGLVQTICPNVDLLIAGFGKLGGREITINSDLDLTFISLSNPNEHITKMAQKILNTLMSYTSEGLSYKVDTRLRPDGSKGILAHGMTGLRDYYLYKAQIWEVQALLKARPITSQNASQFLSLIREIIDKRGHQIMPDDIISMRAKIKKEHFNASLSYEIKLGDGGIQDIEFLVQYLELRNGIAVQNTIAAIGRLCRQNIIDSAQTKILIDSYLFQRTVESFIRLRGLEKKITNNKDALIDALTIFFDYDNNGKFLAFLDTHKCKTIETIKRLLK